MHPEMGRVLAEMRFEQLRGEAAAYRLTRKTARDSKAKRPSRKARRAAAAAAAGRSPSCAEC